MTSVADAVVLAIHYQNEVVHAQGRIRVGIAEDSPHRAAIVAAAGRLLAGARAASVPVISVRIAFSPSYAEVTQNADIWRRVVANGLMQEGSWGAQFHDGLGPLPGETVITHVRNDAFHGSLLGSALQRLRPRRLVVAGIATTYAVESTVRHASDAGYEVVVARDACSAASEQSHEASLAAMAMLAQIMTVDEVVATFAADAVPAP